MNDDYKSVNGSFKPTTEVHKAFRIFYQKRNRFKNKFNFSKTTQVPSSLVDGAMSEKYIFFYLNRIRSQYKIKNEPCPSGTAIMSSLDGFSLNTSLSISCKSDGKRLEYK